MKTAKIIGALLAAACALFPAGAGETGAIKKFVRFPVDTFNLQGQMSPTVLEEATTPPASQISVDGWWGDRKLLLISFETEGARDWYYIHYRAVAMNDQAAWDARLSAAGKLTCHFRTTGAAPKIVAGTKGFSNPC